MNGNMTTIEGTEEAVCEGCSVIPVSHLGLDVDERVGGWLAFLREENIEVATADVGRLSIPRWVLGELLTEQREREARTAAQRAEHAATLEVPVSVGVPALHGASPFESLVAAGGVLTPEQEFGRRPRPNFLEEELAEGRRREGAVRAQQEAVKHAQRVLEGRDAN